MRNLPTGSRFPKAVTERFDLCCGVSFSQSRQRSTESKGQNSTLASALIHRSAWKGYSKKFAFVTNRLKSASLQRYLTTTSPFMPSCSWPSTGQYIS
jgi:hypothetical protein